MPRKPSILLVSPSPNLPGGIARWTGHIVQYYQNNQTKVTLQLLEIGDLYIPKKGAIKPFYRLWRGVKLYIRVINEFRQQIKHNKPEVVHICSSASISLIKDIVLLKIAKKNGLKTIIHFRFGRIPRLLQSRNWEWKLIEMVVRKADTTIVIDKNSFAALYNKNYCNNLELLPNPISDSILEIIAKNKDVTKNEREIVFVGHLLKTKGIFELIDACCQIPNICVKMYGAGSEDVKLALNERAGIGCNWLEVAGEIEYSDVIIKMMQADVFVLPTYTEGFPNVIIESMACGCPIVASGVGAIPEMLNQDAEPVCGILIEPQNVKQLKEAIEKMLNDRDFANKCGENARQRVIELYSMGAMWQKIEGIWMCNYIYKN